MKLEQGASVVAAAAPSGIGVMVASSDGSTALATPHASFRDVLADFARLAIPTPFRRRLFLAASTLWRALFRIDDKERVIAADFAAGRDGYAHDTWIYQVSFHPEISATFLMKTDVVTDPAAKAAALIKGALQFRRAAVAGLLPPEFEAGRPLDMERYRYLFSRVTVTERSPRRRQKIVHRIVDHAPSRHVMLLIRGQFFELTVATPDGSEPSFHDLRAQIQKAIAHSEQPASPRVPFGLLTAYESCSSLALFERLAAANERAIERIDTALFHVAIDVRDHPTGLVETLQAIHSDNLDNRDHRRSMTLVVAGNGRAAAVVDPHAGIGGTLSTGFADALKTAVEQIPMEQPAGTVVDERFSMAPVTLDGRALHPFADQIDRQESEVRRRLQARHLNGTFCMEGIGKTRMRAAGLVPDAAFHCALHLAYARLWGRCPQVGSFINFRNVRFGDIWRYDATTEAMRAFVASPSRATLIAAQDAHRAKIKAEKKASDPFYLGVMSIKRLVSRGEVPFSSVSALMLMSLVLVPQFFRRFFNPDLWVSHIPETDSMEMCGRAGARLSFLRKGSLGGHYMIFDDRIAVSLAPGLDQDGPSPAWRELLPEALNQAFADLFRLI